MPTTLLDGETWEQAKVRRFSEEAAIDEKIIERLRPAQGAFTVTVKTSAGAKQINVLAFTTCDAVVRALDILFDGEQPMPRNGLTISAFPMMKVAA